MPRKKKTPEVIEEEFIPVEEETADEDIINDDGLDDGIELPQNAEEKLNELIELGKKKKNVVSEYSYCSTEEVKEGIVTIHAEIQSDSIKDFKLAKQTLFVDKEDQERVQNSGILSFETL